jgi:hypothetical protein
MTFLPKAFQLHCPSHAVCDSVAGSRAVPQMLCDSGAGRRSCEDRPYAAWAALRISEFTQVE